MISSWLTLAQRVDVFARHHREHKICASGEQRALQSARGSVGGGDAGDGSKNDAGAGVVVKRAERVSRMGQKGSAAARRGADIVLLDDNFATLAAAVAKAVPCTPT